MLSNKTLVAACAVAICCNTAFLVIFVKYNTVKKYQIMINEHQVVTSVIPDDFLSFGVDTSEIENYDMINFSNERLRKLTREISPAHMRLGGTMSDRLIFSKDDDIVTTNKSVCQSVDSCHKFLPFFIMTGQKWTEINEFCNATNVKLLFSLNVLLREVDKENKEGRWFVQNADDIIKYSKERNFDVDWQLGNEPNSFHHTFDINISPRTLALDFKLLRNLLNKNGYDKALLVGPDTTRPQSHRPECLQYMIEFLGNASNTIDVRSWHQYYLNSRTAKWEDFWNPDTFDLLEEQILTMKNHTAKYNNISMWLTETSSSYGGGAPGLSDTYVSSPLWLDKLGLAAKHNITKVVRQSLLGGNYSLIDKDLQPLPDWWLSVLYKKLVGNKVLNIKCNCTRYQRMYAHCANRHYTNDTSALTIYAINLKFEKIQFTLEGSAIPEGNLFIDQYILRAPSNNIKSKKILINGWKMYYGTSMPKISPTIIRHRQISLPPYSIGFWVIKNTAIKICK